MVGEKRHFLPWVFLFAAVGCARVSKHHDRGSVCLGELQPFDTGTELVITGTGSTPVTVVFSTCASGSTDWTDASCTVDVMGDQVLVSTFVKSSSPHRVTADCNWVDWDCGEVELAEGAYTLAYAGAEVPFSVPYTGPPICAPDAP